MHHELPFPFPAELTAATSANGIIFLGTTEGEIFTLDRNFQFKKFSRAITPNAIMAILADYEENIWAGLDSGGVILFPKAKFRSWTSTDGVGTGDAFYIAADHQRNGVWVGTRNGGIAFIASDSKVISFSEKNGPVSNKIRSLMTLFNGTVLVGTEKGLVIIDNDLKPFPVKETAGYSIRSFSVESTQTILVGTSNGFIFRLFMPAKKAKLFFQLPVETQVRKILISRNRIYIASGQRLFIKEGNALSEIKELKTEQINDLLPLRSGEMMVLAEHSGIWFGSSAGWQKKGNQLTKKRKVFRAIPAPDGSIWIGTDCGVLVYETDGRWLVIDSKDGLNSEIIYLIGFDSDGNAWVGGGSGLNLLKNKKVVAHFGYQDGLADNELNAYGFVNDSSGDAWFCTMRGISAINPRNIPRNLVKPKINIQGIEINGIRKDASILSRTSNNRPLELKHYENNLKFTFSALTFTNPTRVRYSYLMTGFDRSWSPPQSERVVFYSRLPPGKYLFLLKCENGDGVWSDQIVLPLKIRSAYYQRFSFKIFIFLIGCGLVYLIVVLRTNAIRKQKERLEKLVSQRTEELARVNRQLQLLSSIDPLTGLYNRRFFQEKIKEDIALSVRQHLRKDGEVKFRPALGFFMIDIDHFKQLNDSEGHETGDAVLKEIGSRFKRTVRASDIVARWGGEEFLLLSKENSTNDVVVLACRLLTAIGGQPFYYLHKSFQKTISIGFCVFPLIPSKPDLFSWEETVRIADQALYISKQEGRNRSTGVKLLKVELSADEITLVKTDLPGAEKSGLIEFLRPN